jgi:uncharacterized protein (DUF2384 family)
MGTFVGTAETAAASSVSVDPAADLARYQQLVERAVEVFGDEVKASFWLSLPTPDFKGKTPLQVAQENGYDLKALEPAFTRIEHGIY